jgi:hypothetical protein
VSRICVNGMEHLGPIEIKCNSAIYGETKRSGVTGATDAGHVSINTGVGVVPFLGTMEGGTFTKTESEAIQVLQLSHR